MTRKKKQRRHISQYAPAPEPVMSETKRRPARQRPQSVYQKARQAQTNSGTEPDHAEADSRRSSRMSAKIKQYVAKQQANNTQQSET